MTMRVAKYSPVYIECPVYTFPVQWDHMSYQANVYTDTIHPFITTGQAPPIRHTAYTVYEIASTPGLQEHPHTAHVTAARKRVKILLQRDSAGATL